MDDDKIVSLGEHKTRQWQQLCLKNARGKLLPNLGNALIALRNDHNIRDAYGYDEMQRVVVMQHEIGQPMSPLDRWVTDNDTALLCEWLQANGFPTIGMEIAHTALMTRARECSFHPVQQYLRSLIWDGVSRLGIWMSSYLGAELNAYNAHIGRMFLTSMVARVMYPGCQADHMLVLEGPQGILKSSACRVLGGKWFSDALPEIAQAQRASQHLRGKWLIEVSEMHAMGKVEATQLKSFITRQTEMYRPSYGRNEVHEPRQCVFVGTTNQDAYLRDPTGGRRFWPVRTGITGSIQLPLLEEYRDQLFAEALINLTQGNQFWPDAQFENEFIKPEQAARYTADIWSDKIVAFLATIVPHDNEPPQTTIPDLARMAIGLPDKDMRQEHLIRISSILRDNGWAPRKSGSKRFWQKSG